jgi:CDP-paratose 2-epimerase
MRIVIFGGAGFIGSNIARYYSNEGNQIIIIDNLSRKCSDLNLKDLLTNQNIKFYNYDIAKNFKEICEIVNADIDVVYHCAAQVAVTTSIIDPRLDLETNILGSFNVLESCRLAKKKPIIFFSSTNKVYGNLDNIPLIIKNSKYTNTEYPDGINEDFSLNFYSPYGCSKGAADQYFLDYSRIYGLKTVVFRKSCIYGNNQFGVEDQGWLSWFAIAMLFQKKITIYGNGSQVRDLLFIDDLMTAYDLALKNIDKTAGKVYNIGGGINFSVSVNEAVERLKMFFNYNVETIFQNERQGDQKYYVSNYNKAKKDFNWEPTVNPELGIKKMLDWIYNNKELIKKIF